MLVIVDCIDVDAKSVGPGTFLSFDYSNKMWTGQIVYEDMNTETSESIELDPLMDWFRERRKTYE